MCKLLRNPISKATKKNKQEGIMMHQTKSISIIEKTRPEHPLLLIDT